jgi:hypothetical protein
VQNYFSSASATASLMLPIYWVNINDLSFAMRRKWQRYLFVLTATGFINVSHSDNFSTVQRVGVWIALKPVKSLATGHLQY